MSVRKRKADDDPSDPNRMSASPSPSPMTSRTTIQTHNRSSKRVRTNIIGRPLALGRLLETLRPDELRTVLQSVCDRHPEIGTEITATAPRPSVSSALNVLHNYQNDLQQAFPYGDRPTSEYAYNRVRASLMDLLEALKDYTPHFLPPEEPQPATSLDFLSGATDVIHQLPDWDRYQHNRHKDEAYEEIARAWALVIREAAKKGGGMQIQYGGWDQKLAKHNELSGGKMIAAINELRSSVSWIGGSTAGFGGSNAQDDSMSIRQQLLSGTYGSNAVSVGPW